MHLERDQNVIEMSKGLVGREERLENSILQALMRWNTLFLRGEQVQKKIKKTDMTKQM